MPQDARQSDNNSLTFKLLDSIVLETTLLFFFSTVRWKEVWLDRLNKSSEPWVHKWLSHQTRDRYWQHGSVAEDYSSISCPVFLIGGFSDLYTDAVFRMIQHLKCPVRAVIGPWSHEWPLGASPGPQIDHLKECLRWWDFHLKGLSTGVMDEPRLKIFLRDGKFCFSNTKEISFSLTNKQINNC